VNISILYIHCVSRTARIAETDMDRVPIIFHCNRALNTSVGLDCSERVTYRDSDYERGVGREAQM